MVAFGGSQHRCVKERMFNHPSGDNGCPVRLYRLAFKLSMLMDVRGDKNSLCCKELSL